MKGAELDSEDSADSDADLRGYGFYGLCSNCVQQYVFKW